MDLNQKGYMKKRIGAAVKITVLILSLIVYLFPFAMVLINSFKTKRDIIKEPMALIGSHGASMVIPFQVIMIPLVSIYGGKQDSRLSRRFPLLQNTLSCPGMPQIDQTQLMKNSLHVLMPVNFWGSSDTVPLTLVSGIFYFLGNYSALFFLSGKMPVEFASPGRWWRNNL